MTDSTTTSPPAETPTTERADHGDAALALAAIRRNVRPHRLLATLLLRETASEQVVDVDEIFVSARINLLIGEWEADVLNAAARLGNRKACDESLDRAAAAFDLALATAEQLLEDASSPAEPTASTLEVDIETEDDAANQSPSEADAHVMPELPQPAATVVAALERELETTRRELAQRRLELEAQHANLERLGDDLAGARSDHAAHVAALHAELEAMRNASAAREVAIEEARQRVQGTLARLRANFSSRMDVVGALGELASAGVVR